MGEAVPGKKQETNNRICAMNVLHCTPSDTSEADDDNDATYRIIIFLHFRDRCGDMSD